MTVKTASWWTQLPPDHARIGICRSVPRAFAGGINYRQLAPPRALKGLEPRAFQAAYDAQLKGLDAHLVLAQIEQLAKGRTPVLVCWESAQHIHAGRCWCHRHLVARWLERELDIEVSEVGWPNLDRFRFLTDPQPFPDRPKRRPNKKGKAKRAAPQQPDLFNRTR
jgi:hypothetical protein